MSLLDSGNQRVVVYPEEEFVNARGTISTRPSQTGIPTMARIDPQNQSGTSARRAEQDTEGFESEEVYAIRFPRSFTTHLGPQSQVEWRGQRWSVFGFPTYFTRSPTTAHVDYTIKRA